MTCHYPDLGSAFDALKRNSLAFQPIRSTSFIWVVTRHQYGVSCTQSFTPWLADEIVFEVKAVFDFDQFMLVIYPLTIHGG